MGENTVRINKIVVKFVMDPNSLSLTLIFNRYTGALYPLLSLILDNIRDYLPFGDKLPS